MVWIGRGDLGGMDLQELLAQEASGTCLHCALGQRKLLIACESLGCVNVGLVLYIHGG